MEGTVTSVGPTAVNLIKISHGPLLHKEIKAFISLIVEQVWLMFIVNCLYRFGILWTQQLTTWADKGLHSLLKMFKLIAPSFACTAKSKFTLTRW